jgi:magnesium transporter
MLTAFAVHQGRLEQIRTGDGAPLPEDAVWVDLVDPTDEQRAQIESMYRQHLPETGEVEEIEATARSFQDESGLHIRSLFLHYVEGNPQNASVAFTLSGTRLFTLHERDVPVFRLLRRRARREPELIQDGTSILLALFETKVDDLADLLEETHNGLKDVGHMVLEEEEADLEDAIAEIAHHEDVNDKLRLCLMDTQRALLFLLRRGRLDTEHAERVREILRDIDSLLPHNTFLFERINFLMQAAQGFINIEQNQIIKIFSIVAVVLLPPTLIASIYGMNFHYMPELSWRWGYPIAIVLMVLSAIAPYAYFKRRGWL